MIKPEREINEIKEIEPVWNPNDVDKLRDIIGKEIEEQLGEYEKICQTCYGLSTLYLWSICPECKNRGKVDWIDKIKGNLK